MRNLIPGYSSLFARSCRWRPVSILVVDPDGLMFLVCTSPSRILFVEALQQSFESSQYVSIRYTERLAEAGIEPSVGSVGDSYDTALAETLFGLYKTEPMRQHESGAR